MTEAQARAAGLTEAEIAELTLDSGDHTDPSKGHCLLEVVSLFAGEKFGDSPACVDVGLAAFGRNWNDNLPDDERQQLKVYITLLPGTAQGPKLAEKRAWMAIDWAIRVNTAAWLELSPATAEHAATLRALAPITGQRELASAQPTLELARKAGAAAWDAARDAAWAAARAAAWDAAWAAARAAAWDAARDAAWAAARAAAWDAAWDAARDAARDAAWDAARDAAQAAQVEGKNPRDAAYNATTDFLAPTTKRLQESAHELYLAMINAKLDEAAALDRVDQVIG